MWHQDVQNWKELEPIDRVLIMKDDQIVGHSPIKIVSFTSPPFKPLPLLGKLLGLFYHVIDELLNGRHAFYRTHRQ